MGSRFPTPRFVSAVARIPVAGDVEELARRKLNCGEADESPNSRIKVRTRSFSEVALLFTVTSFPFNLVTQLWLTFFFPHKSPYSSSVVGLKMSDPFGRKRTKGVFATLVSKGDWLYLRGEYKKAIESYTTVSSRLESLITKFIILSSLTVCHRLGQNSWPARRTNLVFPPQGLSLKPNDRTCFVGRSRCYLKMGQYVDSLIDADASLSGDKTFSEVSDSLFFFPPPFKLNITEQDKW